jgi:large subunit ribosomal protein L25
MGKGKRIVNVQTVMQLEPREKGHASLQKARQNGKVPGVLYGFDGTAIAVQVPLTVLRTALAHGGEHSPFTVQFRGQTQTTIIRDLQREPYNNLPSHFDLMPISSEEPITVTVPIRFLGEHELASRGLQLHIQEHSVILHGKPAAIPEHLELECGQMKLNTTFTAGELQLPEGVTIHEKANTPILHVGHSRVRMEAEEPAPEKRVIVPGPAPAVPKE